MLLITIERNKTEDGEIIHNVHNRCIDDKYKDLTNDIFTNELKDGDLHLTKFNNRIDLKSIVNRYLKEKDFDVYGRFYYLKNSIKNLSDIDDRISIIIAKYKLHK